MRIYVLSFEGEILERSISNTVTEAVNTWEAMYDKYDGRKVKIQLMDKSSTNLSHYCDLDEGTTGWLPRTAARDFLSNM